MENKKGEILIRHLMFGAIVLTMLTFAGVSMISDVLEHNPTMAGTGDLEYFNESFNKKEEIVAQMGALEGNVTSTGIQNIPAVGPTADLIMKTWGYIQGTFTTVGFIKNVFTDGLAATQLPIPAWVGVLVSAALTFLVGFIILSLIFRGKI